MKKQARFMLDIARKYYTVDEIKAFMKYAAQCGYTSFQLHISDDTNYAIESAILGQSGHAADGTGKVTNTATTKPYLSAAQVKDIANYAAGLNLQIIPEIGSPAHMGGFFDLYGRKNGTEKLAEIKNDYNELRYTTPAVIEFMQTVYKEVIDMFGGVKRFHLGGDEHGATYNAQYNQEFVDYINKQAAYIKSLGIIPVMWNDGIMPATMQNLDKDIEVVFWAWDGDKPTERENLIKIRASFPQIIEAGFTAYNANSYYAYTVPRTRDRITGDANYAANDAASNWNLSVWDSNRTENRLADDSGVAGAMMCVWGELITDDQTGFDVLKALAPHMKTIADLALDRYNVQDFIKISSYAEGDVYPPNKILILKTENGMKLGTTTNDGRSVVWMDTTDLKGEKGDRGEQGPAGPAGPAGTGGSLTTEQQQALARFVAAVGTGATMDVENITDVINLTVGANVTRLRIRSYTGNSGLGGGEFGKVENSVAADPGMILKTKDGMTFKRDLSVDDYLTPYMFGYTDGITDASNHFQTLLNEAAQYKCRIRLPKNGLMPLKRAAWSIPVGIKEIDGNNCTIRHETANNNEMYLADAIDGLHIHHLNIRHASSVSRAAGIFGTGALNVEISYCDIETKANHGVLCRIKRKSGKSIHGWHVHHNNINVDRGIDYTNSTTYISSNGAYQGILFDVDTITDASTSNNMDGLWTQLKTVPDADGVRHRNHSIHDNYITRSRYGVGMYFTDGATIYNNRIEDVVRAVSLQDRTMNIHVHHNTFTNFTTGVLNNYMCESNVITDNLLRRTEDWHFKGTGQAFIAGWVQPKNIIVRNNRCESFSAAGPSWAIAFGVNAEGNIAEGNIIVGKIGRSVFNTESSWAAAIDNTIGYGLDNPNWATTDTKNNSFIGNHIDVTTPCVIMAAISNNDNGVVRKNVGTVFRNNVIKGNSAVAKTMFRVMERSAGGVTGLVVEGNTYQVDAPASKFIMGTAANYARLAPEVGRPSVQFETAAGGAAALPSDLETRLATLSNLVMGTSASVDLDTDGVLNITANNNSYSLRNLAAENTNTVLKKIAGGTFGREIVVQFQSGYSVEHSDSLRLTGSANLTTGINGNTFLRFKCIDPTNQKWAQL